MTISNSSFVKKQPIGFLSVYVITNDGILLPGCEILLTGPNGRVSVHSYQRGKTSFIAEPGPYQLSVSFPGFKAVQQQVEVKATEMGRYNPRDHEL